MQKGLALHIGIDGHQIIDTIDLQAMAGIVEETDVGPGELLLEFGEAVDDSIVVEVASLHNGKTKSLQRIRHCGGVASWILQRAYVQVFAVADDESHPPLSHIPACHVHVAPPRKRHEYSHAAVASQLKEQVGSAMASGPMHRRAIGSRECFRGSGPHSEREMPLPVRRGRSAQVWRSASRCESCDPSHTSGRDPEGGRGGTFSCAAAQKARGDAAGRCLRTRRRPTRPCPRSAASSARRRECRRARRRNRWSRTGPPPPSPRRSPAP